jgi:multiple sugar transport system substrate-binding protein
VSRRSNSRDASLVVSGWEHRRCLGPLLAAADRFGHGQDVEVRIETRSLASFNDEPLDRVFAGVDAAVLDHPHIAWCVERRLLLPFEHVMDRSVLGRIAADSVGNTFASYVHDGLTWALPIDAASQASVARPDLLVRLGAERPTDWSEVLDLAERHPGHVRMPGFHSDLACCLVTLVATMGGSASLAAIERDLEPAVRLLVELARRDVCAFGTNPPELVDSMASSDAIAYVPLTFAYSPTTLAGATISLEFDAPPRLGSRSGRGILGGAGLAVSSASEHTDLAAAFAGFVASGRGQMDIVEPNGGQSSSVAVWDDPKVDAAAQGFYSALRRPIDQAVIRPRNAWWPKFQHDLGRTLEESLQSGDDPADIVPRIRTLLVSHRNTSGSPSAAERKEHDARRP